MACLLIVLAACRTPEVDRVPPIVQPGAPGEPARVVTPEHAAGAAAIGHTPADVRFMLGMIHHHAQALEMTALVPARTGREAIRKLALRIEISQADEIHMMEQWLKARGEPLPVADAHRGHGPLMPGMLTAEEMARLAAARGDEFDRLFLEYMIRHHEGALVMVRQLFSEPGAGQEAEIFSFASDVEADQSMEIQRMRAMLGELRS